MYYVEIDKPADEIGGEGKIYMLDYPHLGKCVIKLYNNQDKALKCREKILYLLMQPIPFINNWVRYCWPIGAVYDEIDNEFLGFIMPKAFEGSRDLLILDTYYPNQTIDDVFPKDVDWHSRFELLTEKGLKNRLIILHNLAQAIKGLHRTEEYVLGDIKPENVMMTSEGKVSIIDIDSCQVMKNGKLLFENSARTPNYFPHEAYEKIKKHEAIDNSCDAFSLGCVFYSILVGCSPYSNIVLKSPFDNGEFDTISARIKAELYYRGTNSPYIDKVNGLDLHKNIERLSSDIQTLFDRTFSLCENRPSMTEWRKVLNQAILSF